DEERRYRAAALPKGGDPVDRIGELSFEHVWFEYLDDQPVLKDMSFSVAPGELIGIVGPSGAGKSTLMQLILRLRPPTSGRVLADGRNADEFAYADWYQHVTFVPQESSLFAGTIAENILFFRDGYDQADVMQAAKRAHLHDEIMARPQGYDTPV